MKKSFFINTTITILSLLLLAGCNRHKQSVDNLQLAGNSQQLADSTSKTVSTNQSKLAVQEPASGRATYTCQGEGTIGLMDDKNFDNPQDNRFIIQLKEAPAPTDKVWLSYDLYGVSDNSGISKSINDRLTTGGYLVKQNTSWTKQQQELNYTWVKKGENTILFTLPENAPYGYKVRKVSLQIQKGAAASAVAQDGLILTQAISKDKIYLHGTIAGQVAGKATFYANGKTIANHNGEFETILANTDNGATKIEAVLADGRRIERILQKQTATTYDYQYPLEQYQAQVAKTFTQNRADSLQTDNIKLQAGLKTLLAKTQPVSITPLRGIDIPALDQGMSNVTKRDGGFRLLPHGTLFSEGSQAQIAMAYDRKQIPDGYTEDDIRTYYFDNNTGHWEALERDTIDKVKQLIVSRTTHFTDMINGVIKTPESPETQGFAPTMMNDIKAADPTAKVQLIAAPGANNRGSAGMSYSFEMPPARNGMSPQLGIQYNSDGGQGWLGEGWNLSTPGISIDTRWGVPRYDDDKETETYSMGGSMLMTMDDAGQPSVAHRGDKIARKSDRQFYPRNEGSFSKIIRKGSNPSNYSWEVTDKSGTKYTYGGSGAVLKGSITNIKGEQKEVITEWKLTRVEELHGDYIEYVYETADEPVKGSLTAKAIYLKEVHAGNKGQEPHTVVTLTSSATAKHKQASSARYGFLTSDNRLLEKVSINFEGSELRSYVFSYKLGAFSNDLLDKVTHKDPQGNDFASHTFDYYDDVKSKEGYKPFTDKSEIFKLPVDGINASALGGSKTSTIGGSFYAGVGALIGSDFMKGSTVGASVSYSRATNKGVSSLVDINGDGLADKVFEDGGKLYYRANLSQPGDSIVKFAEAITVKGIGEFSKTISSSFSYGGKAGSGYMDATVTVGIDNSKTTSTTKTYFKDVNNDGLIDIVKSGKVYFNHIEIVNGKATPTFTLSSGDTPAPIMAGGNIDASDTQVDPQEQEDLVKASPMYDVVRVWEAPFGGTVKIDGTVKLQLPTGSYDAEEYAKSDGVRAAIQTAGSERWDKVIAKGDATVYNASINSLAVEKGQKIYFRVQSGNQKMSNGAFDQVDWSPVISYTDATKINAVNPDGQGSYIYKATEGDVLSVAGPTRVPDGAMRLTGNFTKPVTSDNVRLQIVFSNDSLKNDGTVNTAYAKSTIYDKTFAPQETYNGDIAIPTINNTIAGHNFLFLVSSAGNVAWEKVKWNPLVYVTPDGGSEQATPATVQYNIYANQVLEGAPLALNTNDTVTAITPAFIYRADLAPADIAQINGKLRMSLKKTTGLLAEKTVTIQNGVIQAPAGLTGLKAPAGGNVWLEFFTDDTSLAGKIAIAAASISVKDANNLVSDKQAKAGIFTPKHEEGMGIMNRGWGQFIYNAAEDRYAASIDESLLKLPQDQNANIDPLTMTFIPMGPDVKSKSYWAGADEYVYVKGNTMSASRLGEDDVVLTNPIQAQSQMFIPPCEDPENDLPDPYTKGQTGEMTLWLSSSAPNYGVYAYDYDNNKALAEYAGVWKTYPTLGIGEYEIMSKNLSLPYRNKWSVALAWMNFDQSVINQMNQDFQQKDNVDLNTFNDINGSYISLYNDASSYRNAFSVYDKARTTQLSGWDLMSSVDFMQLFGQAPLVSTNPIENIMNFLGANKADVPATYTADWFEYKNTSGFTMTPLGRRHSGEAGYNGQKWIAYKEESGFRLKDYPTGIILFNKSQGISISGNLYHLCQARYSRAKTDQELGYKMYIDAANDQVVMLPYDQASTLAELPKGVERGVALRYSNKAKMRVLKKWSEIQAQADIIKRAIDGQSVQIPIDPVVPIKPAKSCEPINKCVVGTGMNAIELKSQSKSTDKMVGAGYSTSLGGGITYNEADGEDKVITDYNDMNGDGYPDVITPNQIQYTGTLGGFQDNEIMKISGINHASKSKNKSWGLSGNASHASSTTAAEAKFKTAVAEYKAAGTNEKATKRSVVNEKAKAIEEAKNSVSVSTSGSVPLNEDWADHTLSDVNGDGLPDRVLSDKRVQINLGYGFSEPVDWGLTDIQSGQSTTVNTGMGGSFDIGSGSISGGISSAITTSKVNYSLTDMNSDGLADKVRRDGNRIYVSFNTGNSFTSEIQWQGPTRISESSSMGFSANAAYTLPILIPLLPSTTILKIPLNPGVSYGTANSNPNYDIRDIDGDGYPDIVSSSSEDTLVMQRSTIARTNKLQTVHNPLGGSFTLDYGRTQATYGHPGGKWVLASVTADDGLRDDGANIKTTFRYEEGNQDRREREFLGFGKVITESRNTEARDSVYRRSIQEYDVKNVYTAGNELRTSTEDAAGRKYAESNNVYYTYQVTASGDDYRYASTDTICTDRTISFTPLKYAQSKVYEGQTTGIIANESYYEYYLDGNYGELKSYKYSDKATLGVNGTGGYNYLTAVQYTNNKSKHILSLPTQVTVTGSDGKPYRQTSAVYDLNVGVHLTNVTQTLNSVGDKASVDFVYDKYGNITKKTLPANSKNQRMWYTYRYDSRYNMYVERVDDAFGYQSNMENYDYRFGMPLKTRDYNNYYLETTIDDMGRVLTILGPNEAAQGVPYTIKFEYPASPNPSQGGAFKPAYALTKHYDPANPGDDIETATFTDGFGRAVQVKKDGEIMASPGGVVTKGMIVSGRAKFDAFGRVKEAYYPVNEALGNKTEFNPQFDAITPTKTVYDILDRALTTTLPDGAVTKMEYGLDGQLLKTTAIDAKGGKQSTFTNGSGLTMKQEQYSGPAGTITTSYFYDPINELLQVQDTKGNLTTSVYDMAGRRLSVTHPDNGTTSFKYDNLGNLLSRQTANLEKEGKYITYEYDYSRLTKINYPDHPENNVHYTYGSKNATNNRVGRLVLQEDGSGAQEFSYGRQGELTAVTRTMIIPNQAIATYTTKWKYDTWNRLQEMIYPDQEKLTYTYNTGGQLTGVKGSKAYSYNYVQNIGYDKFEQRIYMKYCNGAETKYAYDAQRRRLSNLQVIKNPKAGTSAAIMDNDYSYDAVSNILSVTNKAPLPTGTQQGGQMTHSYGYDGLYRLTTATGTYNTSPQPPAQGGGARNASYTLKMSYDNLHNITSKQQDVVQNGVTFNGTLKAGYSLAYNYTDEKSHKLSNIEDASYRTENTDSKEINKKKNQYTYDANGNLIYVNTERYKKDGTHDSLGNERKLLWDEENRLEAVDDNGYVSNYWYDAAGERTVKTSGESEGLYVLGLFSGGRTETANFTLYVNPYLVVSKGGKYTKHIYIGSQRIVSKLGDLGSFGADPRRVEYAGANADVPTPDYKAKYATQQQIIKDRYDTLKVVYNGKNNDDYVNGLGFCCNDNGSGTLRSFDVTKNDNPELYQYYYHSDHLGSSSFITNLDGEVAQHIEYVPFGEVFVEERNNSWNTPYLFNAKELDSETGLYYYGARYYDGKTSLWLSSDVLREKYPAMSSYAYVENNPVKYIDPDGREKLIGFNIDSPNPEIRKREISLTAGAMLENDNNMIHIYAHGSSERFAFYDADLKKTIYVASSADLNKFLSERSELWKNKKEGELMYIVLHSCMTGREQVQNSGFVMPSVAEWFSELENTVIIAPDQRMVIGNKSGEDPIWKQLGVDRNGKWLTSKKEFSIIEYGNWNVFSEINKVGSFVGNLDNKPQNVSNHDIRLSKLQYGNRKLPKWLQSPVINSIKANIIPGK